MGYLRRHSALGRAGNYAISLQNRIRARPKIGVFTADCLCVFALEPLEIIDECSSRN